MNARTTPPARSIAIIAKVVHDEVEVTRVGINLFVAGSSTTSLVVRPHLLALAIKDLRRRDAFSQDLFDVRLDKPSKQFSKCPIISRRVSFSSQSRRCSDRRKVADANWNRGRTSDLSILESQWVHKWAFLPSFRCYIACRIIPLSGKGRLMFKRLFQFMLFSGCEVSKDILAN